MTPQEIAALEEDISANPEKGAVIAGTGGLRKIRVAAKGHGKRGGARIIYYFWQMEKIILLLTAYTKNQKDDLSAYECKILAKEVRDLKEGYYET